MVDALPIRDGRQTSAHKHEHPISRLIVSKGFTRTALRTRLGIKSPQFWGKCMTAPGKYLTVDQVEMLAGILDMSFLEMLALIRGMKPSKARKWYDQNDDSSEFKPAKPVNYPTR